MLERNKLPLGIVTSIRGSFRFRDAICKGEYLHSGATPIDYRKDSVVAVSSLVNEMIVVLISFKVNWSILNVGFVNTISKRSLNSPTSEVNE